MILVVGLAVAGLAGIAAAFYFSTQRGRRGDKHNPRGRSAGVVGRLVASTQNAGPGRAGNGSRAANGSHGGIRRRANQAADNYGDDTGLNSDLDFPASDEAEDGAEDSRTARARRRVGFRKGADVDEELWPTEAFGGVSDEQFWDDLAADKPLTTTARTAQHDSGRRVGQFAPRIEPRGRDQTARLPEPPVRAAGSRPGTSADTVAGAADAGRENLAGQAADQADYAATQPVTSFKPVTSFEPVTSFKPVGGTGPLPRSGRRPGAASRPGTSSRPGEGRRHAIPSADDDPLTSSAFSLRAAGPVDGNSFRPAGPSRGRDYPPSAAEESQPPTAGEANSGGYLPSPPAPRHLAAGYGAAAYEPASYETPAYGTPAYKGDPARTPPNGDSYGYRSPGPLDEARRPNGARPNGARPRPRYTGPEGRDQAPRPAYPQPGQPGGHRSGSENQNHGNRGGGGQQANGYPGTGRHGGGHRAPYDPREDYRRLEPQKPRTPQRPRAPRAARRPRA